MELINNMPMATYREIELLNKSTLNNWVKGKSPRQSLFSKDTQSLNEGRIIHDIIENLGNLDTLTISPFKDFKTKEAQQWRDSQTSDIIKTKDIERYQTVYDQIDTECTKQGLNIKTGQHEVTGITDTEKIRIDYITDMGLVDWKSIANASPKKCFQAIDIYNYDLQAYMYSKVYKEITDKHLSFTFVFFELKPPFNVTIITMSNLAMRVGKCKYDTALIRYNTIPANQGYSDKIIEYTPNKWTLDEVGLEDNPFK